MTPYIYNMKYLAYLILLLTIIFNLWLYYPETQILADPNDNIFQYSLVGRTNWVWENYGCPLSPSCLPNLVDHNVPNWAEGYPLPFYYSHVPQIVTVASYQLIVRPLSLIANSQLPITLYQYYNWTKYLLLSLFPLSVFIALRIVGFSPILSSLGAFFGANLSTDGLYGIDPPSYLWRGYGLTSQLYAIIFLPLAVAFVYRALKSVNGDDARIVIRLRKTSDVKPNWLRNLLTLFFSPLLLSILFLTLTTAGHLGIGIIGILSTIPFLFFDFKITNIISRGKKLFLILSSVFFLLSYWLIPILLNNNYHIISFWDPIWKFNSYGWYEVVKQFFNGEIFDWQRFPILTGLVLIGFFVLAVRKKYFPFALLFAFWFLLYFGRTTWGGLIDLIPGMKDFHHSRFVVGVHMAALFLIPAGLEFMWKFLHKIYNFTEKIISNWLLAIREKNKSSSPNYLIANYQLYANITFYILIFIFISFLIFFTAKQTVSYATLNNKWIYQANDAYRYDETNFKNMLAKIDPKKGRVYAGRPGNWGKNFRLGSTQLYLLLGGIGYDLSQFLPETWSPLSENEQNFDEREAVDYDLLNIRYVISDKNQGFAKEVKLENKYGPFELYQAPTTGWFDVVTSPMFVKTDKTNYINLVHLWWNSYSRRWKMNPLISVEKNPVIPTGMQRIIEMKDEVSYIENGNSYGNDARNVKGLGQTENTSDVTSYRNGLPNPNPFTTAKNIFSDFPFVFPEATISATISSEKVDKQSYSATIDVPANCNNCMAMFKMSYHPDWQVKVDGKDAGKFAVFPFYLATPATPGTHTVEFTYQPNRLKIILLVGEILVGIIILLLKKKINTFF